MDSVPTPSFLTLCAVGWGRTAQSWGNGLESNSPHAENGGIERWKEAAFVVTLLNYWTNTRLAQLPAFLCETQNQTIKPLYLVYFLLVILHLKIGTLSKNMSSGTMGIGSDATTDGQLDWMRRGETMTWLWRESEKKEIKPRTLLDKAVYAGIKGIKSGFRKIMAQILSLPFVSCEQVL